MSTHTKQKELDSKSGDSAQPMNVNINIACSIDPQTGASQCRIFHPETASVENDIVDEILRLRKKEEEEDVEEEEELEKKSSKSKTKKPSKHDTHEGDEDTDGDKEDADSDEDEEDEDDEDSNDSEDEILECMTRSTMKKR